MKLEKAVVRETGFVAVWVGILSLLTQGVFLLLRQWDVTVLLGNLLSGGVGILNFFLMAVTVQIAAPKEQKDAVKTVRLSQSLRFLLLGVAAAVGAALPQVFSIWTVLIPLFFPRIAVAIRMLMNRRDSQ